MTTTQQSRNAPGPKPRFNRDEILDVALRVLAEDGPTALSLRRLGREVGMTARAIYGYFESKDDLESAVVAKILPELPARDANVPWHDALRARVMEIHDALVRHPGAARLLSTRSTSSPVMDKIREQLLVLLRESGLGPRDTVSALGTLSRYLMGCVVIEEERRLGGSELESARMSTLSEDDFPVLRSFAHAYADRNALESTRFGLDLIVLGLRDLAEGSPR